MRIPVVDKSEDHNLVLEFVDYFRGEKRLWIRDPKQWFQTVGRYCPHRNISGFECVDCALNVE